MKKNKEGVEKNCFRIKLMIGLTIAILAIFLFYTSFLAINLFVSPMIILVIV